MSADQLHPGMSSGPGLETAGIRPHTTSPRLGANEQSVLDAIRKSGQISRTGISRITGLSAATTGRIAGRFIADDVLAERGIRANRVGRPSILLEINAGRASVIAIDLGGERISAALADLTGQTVWQETARTGPGSNPYAAILSSIETARSRAAALSTPIAAVAIGVPAIVDQENGLALAGPNVHWSEFNLVRRLSQDLDIPFIVDNDVNLAAIGHYWSGDATAVDDFALFSIGTGIGGAIMSRGRLIRGHRNAAGEFGCIATDPASVFDGTVHTIGSLEKTVSGPGVANVTKDLLATSDDSSLLDVEGPIRSEDTFAAALAGDPLALEVMDLVLRRLTVAVIGVVCVTAPELVILEGSVGRSLGPFLDDIRDSVRHHVPDEPVIEVATTSTNATLDGAIQIGLEVAWHNELPAQVSGNLVP